MMKAEANQGDHLHASTGEQAGHSHSHGHGHSHSHGVTNEKRVAWAFVIIFVFMFIEVIGGLWSGSLALLADAGHMVSDAAALGLSWVALRLGQRPATDRLTYGYRRFEILAAFVNGCTLFLIAGWIVYEAVRRLFEPVAVLGGAMLVIALAGLLANIVAFLVLNGGDRTNLNMRSAWLHVLGDMLGFVVALVAAGIIMATGWAPIDPILSMVVALLILKSAWGIVKSSAHVLLEGAPDNIDLAQIKSDLEASLPEVQEAHHIHVWSITPEQTLLTLHVRPAPAARAPDVIAAVQQRLRERFQVGHTTVQIETESCEVGAESSSTGNAACV
ncbi:cation diffusion facilitator family transporter [Paraburkholderia sp. SIMBA_055]